jgi:ribosomal protein S27AE
MGLPIGIDINGLSTEHQQRIRVIGLDAWMDEQSRPVPQPINKPRRTWRNCVQCGKPFLAKRADARLCSPKCRVRAVRYPQERPACNT